MQYITILNKKLL